MLSLTLLNVQTLLVGLTVGLLVFYIRRRMRYRLPPGPWCLPFIGNYEVYPKPLMHRTFLDLSKKYGPVFRAYFGTEMVVVLNNYEVVMEALVKKKSDFAGRPPLTTYELITEGYKDIAFTTYSPTWKINRRMAVKAIRNYLQEDLLEQLTHDNMENAMNVMSTENGKHITLQSYLEDIVYYSLFTLCFGEQKSIGDPEVMLLKSAKHVLNKNYGNGLREDFLPILKDIFPSRRYLTMKEALEKIHHFLYNNLEKHKETFDASNIRDLTDHLLLERSVMEGNEDEETLEVLCDTYIVQTLDDIFFAGVDTNISVLDWFFCFMSGYPDVQTRCQEEIDKNIGRRVPSIEDRNILPYTEACMYETLRAGVHSGLSIPHFTMRDTKVGGYDVPEDTLVLINIFALHRDSKYWNNPEQFDPLRYLNDKGEINHDKLESWLPFSAGKRRCLGENLAKPQIFLMCVHLLQRFHVALPAGVEPMFVGEHGTLIGTEQPIGQRILIQERFQRSQL